MAVYNPSIQLDAEFGHFADIIESEPCRDSDPELQDCSEGGALDVMGRLFTARPTDTLGEGPVYVSISGWSLAPDLRYVNYSVLNQFTIDLDDVAATTVTTTSEISTTTTNGL